MRALLLSQVVRTLDTATDSALAGSEESMEVLWVAAGVLGITEVVSLPGRHEDRRVLPKIFSHRCGRGLLSSDNDEVREHPTLPLLPGGLSANSGAAPATVTEPRHLASVTVMRYERGTVGTDEENVSGEGGASRER